MCHLQIQGDPYRCAVNKENKEVVNRERMPSAGSEKQVNLASISLILSLFLSLFGSIKMGVESRLKWKIWKFLKFKR